ncbi:MAG: DUF4417 domain-containing protein [Acidimicrobiia bacterium]|nr:DUF4417 domain-containing protein [Acidimicrobiia bacterium]
MTATSSLGGRNGPTAPARGCDCSACPFFSENPQAREPVCSGTNTDCWYCGCARADGAAGNTTKCGQCPVRCGSRVDIDAWMADIGDTVTFDDVDLAGQHELLDASVLRTRFIPQVDTRELAGLDHGLHWPAYAIGLRRILSAETGAMLPGWSRNTAHAALGLRSDQRAVLVCYGTDPDVECFWTRRHRLIAQLAEHEWDLVLAPNYSQYGNHPRAEMLINYRRNLLVCQEMLDAGIPAVPNLYWFRIEDLHRYQDWLDCYRPRAIAKNLQTLRRDTSWDDIARPGLTYLAGTMPPETLFYACGASRADRIGELRDLFGDRLRLVSQNPIMYARHGAVMTSHGRDDVHARTPDAFAANVRHYADLVAGDTRRA